MLKTCRLGANKFFYYDIERQTIARFPTNSNLLLKGSDNSLFFGMKSDDKLCKLFSEFFRVPKIDDIKGLNFDMKFGSSDEFVNVQVNLNAQGQIQIKICKDGTMGKLAEDYSFIKMKQFDFAKMLIVVDFQNKEIRFKDPNELVL